MPGLQAGSPVERGCRTDPPSARVSAALAPKSPRTVNPAPRRALQVQEPSTPEERMRTLQIAAALALLVLSVGCAAYPDRGRHETPAPLTQLKEKGAVYETLWLFSASPALLNLAGEEAAPPERLLLFEVPRGYVACLSFADIDLGGGPGGG